MGDEKETRMKKPLYQRIRHRLMRMRLHPIRVFVFHQVSEQFKPETMWECDWTRTDVFKSLLSELKRRYSFIPLDEAYERLQQDRVRLKDYAVLTSDDGWASLKEILPWLAEQQIPVTLFLNPSCLDGIHKHSRETDELLTEVEIRQLADEYRPLISIASHGWTHKDCTEMTLEEFADSVRKSEETLKTLPGKVSFYAFASGLSKPEQMDYLRQNALVPVWVDGMKNDSGTDLIHRECLDGKTTI